MMNLDSITIGGDQRPPRIVVYGPHGVGKTTFAVSAPRPIVLRTEDGLATLRVPTFPMASHYSHVIQALSALYGQPHKYETLVLDSLDWLEPLIWAQTAMLLGKDHIEDVGYGKGYVQAADQWSEVLDGLNALNSAGMTIICIAHAEIKRFDSPHSEPYDRYQPKLHKRAADLVQEWADVVGFAHYEVHTEKTDTGFNKQVVRGVGAGVRRLAVEERPAYQAKNRYQLPAVLPLAWQPVQDAIAAAYAAPPAAPEEVTVPVTEEEPEPVAAAAAAGSDFS